MAQTALRDSLPLSAIYCPSQHLQRTNSRNRVGPRSDSGDIGLRSIIASSRNGQGCHIHQHGRKLQPMNLRRYRATYRAAVFHIVAPIVCGSALISSAQTPTPQQAQSQVMNTTTTEQEPAQKMPPEQLDSLVAPIALFSDPLLATTLAASTYPLEIIQLQQWMQRNKSLRDKALGDAVAKQPWDASVQSLAATPDVVQRLADNIQWTTDLGNAFLAQQPDVME